MLDLLGLLEIEIKTNKQVIESLEESAQFVLSSCPSVVVEIASLFEILHLKNAQ